jgi:Uma2 family endonuclease
MDLAQSFVTWAEFLRLPERPEGGKRYELHDGEVVLAPPAHPLNIKLQKRIERLLESLAGERGVVATEFPYRPVPNLQYWFADVAYIPQADWDALPPNEYPIYAPPLIVEVLSPSNTTAKVDRQRIVAMSAGAEEFWVVDADARTVQVTDFRGVTIYGAGDSISSAVFEGGQIPVEQIFAQLLP